MKAVTVLASLLAFTFTLNVVAADKKADKTEKKEEPKAVEVKASDDVDENDDRVPLPPAKYFTGAGVGTGVGFGIGHAIQGRYADKGWIFTVGEAVSLTVIIASVGNCIGGGLFGGSGSNCGGVTVGYAGLLGFHIWEIVDLWVGARPVFKDTRLMIIPDPQAPRLVYAYSF